MECRLETTLSLSCCYVSANHIQVLAGGFDSESMRNGERGQRAGERAVLLVSNEVSRTLVEFFSRAGNVSMKVRPMIARLRGSILSSESSGVCQ